MRILATCPAINFRVLLRVNNEVERLTRGRTWLKNHCETKVPSVQVPFQLVHFLCFSDSNKVIVGRPLLLWQQSGIIFPDFNLHMSPRAKGFVISPMLTRKLTLFFGKTLIIPLSFVVPEVEKSKRATAGKLPRHPGYLTGFCLTLLPALCAGRIWLSPWKGIFPVVKIPKILHCGTCNHAQNNQNPIFLFIITDSYLRYFELFQRPRMVCWERERKCRFPHRFVGLPFRLFGLWWHHFFQRSDDTLPR